MQGQIHSLKDQIETLLQCKKLLGQEVDDLTSDLEEGRMNQEEVEVELSEIKVRSYDEICV